MDLKIYYARNILRDFYSFTVKRLQEMSADEIVKQMNKRGYEWRGGKWRSTRREYPAT